MAKSKWYDGAYTNNDPPKYTDKVIGGQGGGEGPFLRLDSDNLASFVGW